MVTVPKMSQSSELTLLRAASGLLGLKPGGGYTQVAHTTAMPRRRGCDLLLRAALVESQEGHRCLGVLLGLWGLGGASS